MSFTINSSILNEGALFLEEKDAYSGVRKIAAKVMRDIEQVFGARPTAAEERSGLASQAVVYGTIDRSPALQELAERGLIDLEAIRGKNEVYLFQAIDAPADWTGVSKLLVIAGSDKRGAIYGLFRLSELLGVSPYVNWNNVKPKRLETFAFNDAHNIISREPSVRYRGFFINDEWPAFGTWCNTRFGGFNAEMYDHVFELLLRLKGNYLWPAMWSARFYDDGPGLANAELADEYGVVMGASHHEPCLRQGEEYKYLRGPGSIYGDAWNFRSNEEGITRFWADALKERSKFENVITVGMRGEADTAIMGKGATLADNIELLRDVLRTQNRLMKEHVNPNLEQVPRMLALYKEVEPFFYGNEETPGLIGSEELEDVILMLCDDNFGNLRTLPTEEMRAHKGGYGMYYHFDYHGGPISFEWINSSYLPKIWEQMTMAYDFGIRDLWVVNVGDIATQEFPLAYFLDMAYDFDTWGTSAINKTDDYTKRWVGQQFGSVCSAEDLQAIHNILDGYTQVTHNRRPEAMNADVYHPVHYEETDRLLTGIEYMMEEADRLYKKMDAETMPAFFALVYYPAMGNLNLQKMQLLAGKNQYAAKLNMMEANRLAEQIQACMKRDRELVDEYHALDGGRWYGMGLSEHIGFTKWNEDECRYPIVANVMPAAKPRLIVSIDGTSHRSEGSSWHIHTLQMTAFRRPDVSEAGFTISSLSDIEAPYTIECEAPWLSCSTAKGQLDGRTRTTERITVRIDRSKMKDGTEAAIMVKIPSGTVTINVDAALPALSGLAECTFVDTDGYIAIEAEHYAANVPGAGAAFQVIDGYGKTLSAVKVFPTTQTFTAGVDAPYVEYQFVVSEAGKYEVELYMQPSNPVTAANTLYYGVQANDGAIDVRNAIPEGIKVGSEHNALWAAGVLDNIRRRSSEIECVSGLNTLRIYAVSPGFVLEKLVIYPIGKQPAPSYLGPLESYYIGKQH